MAEDGESGPVVELLVYERACLERHEAQGVPTEKQCWFLVGVAGEGETLAVAFKGIGFVALPSVFQCWFVGHDDVVV
jgi:hypothetical protein